MSGALGDVHVNGACNSQSRRACDKKITMSTNKKTLKQLAEQAMARWGKPHGFGPYGYYWLIGEGYIGERQFGLVHPLSGPVTLVLYGAGIDVSKISIDVSEMRTIEQVLSRIGLNYYEMSTLDDLTECLVRLGMDPVPDGPDLDPKEN